MRSRRFPVAGGAFVLAVALNSCGGGGDSSGPPAPAAVASVEITPAPSTITVSRTLQLSAATKDAGGNVLYGRVVTWSQVDAAIATVNSSGLVSAVGVGATTITATSEGKSGNASVTVIAVAGVAVENVVISPAVPSLQVGQTAQLTVTTTDASGNTLTGRTVSWSTNSPATATVSGSGLLTAVAPGSAVITATSEGRAGTATVSVVIGQRVTGDRPDEVSGLQIKIVYLTSADGPDRGLDTTGVLQSSVASFQNWFAGKTGKVQRQDSYQGRLDISYFKSSKTDAEIAAQGAFVVTELYRQLAEAGFRDPNKRYLIYYDGTSTYACGGALLNGQAAAMYLRAVLSSGASCLAQQFVTSPTAPPRYWEFAMLHDSFHIGGIVDAKAPDHYAPNPSHVNDPADLMHGGPAPWQPSVVDATGHNYYGDNVPAGVTNLKNDPILVSASASVMARASLQVRALRESPQTPIPYHVHEIVRQR